MDWNQIIGHEQTKTFLQQLAAATQRPHAFLLSGLAGIGKRLVAEAFAETLLCDSGPNPCGSCKNCRYFAQGSHPDYFLLQPELKTDGVTRKDSIAIAQVRELLKEAAFLPKEGTSRVAVIDDAHLLTQEASNSLLKLLEEPPAGWIFVLVASNLELILPTILSRVTIIKLDRLSEQEILTYFAQAQLDTKQMSTAASLADGSIGQALYFAEPQAETTRLETIDFLQACLLRDHLAAAGFVKKIAKEKAVFACQFLAAFVRDAWRLKIEDNQSVWNKDLQENLGKLSAGLSIVALSKLLQHVETTLDAIKRASNPQLAMEGLYILIGNEV